MGMTVLVTGVTRYLGSALAGRLAGLPGVDRVVGVDLALPEPSARARMGAADFVRADIRHPLIAKVLDAAGVDTVVHAAASATPAGSAAGSMVRETNVVGTMQLLAACQRSSLISSLVVRSTSAVYGGSSRDAAVVTEDMTAHSLAGNAFARDAVDIEGYARGFARRRPDVRVVVPRLAEIVGPTVRTPLTRYFAMSPLVPVVAGTDARMQFVHQDDAVDVLVTLVLGDFAGTVNVAGSGAMTLNQAIARTGRLPLPLPTFALNGVGRLLRLAGTGGFSTAQVRSLSVDRVMDTTRLHREVGFVPRYTSRAAFDDFAASLFRPLQPGTARRAEASLDRLIGVSPAPPPARPSSVTDLARTGGGRRGHLRPVVAPVGRADNG